jgi:predicted enzyme related to lactoylglutathione lyase
MMMRAAFAAAAALLIAGATQAQGVTLWAARVGAEDVEGAAEFYKAAFGMQEVDRLMFPSGEPEIILNFGATLEEAQANTDSHIAIMPREANDSEDPVPPLMLHVADIQATAQAVKDAGGTVYREPMAFGGASLAFVQDPAGNRIELIQPAADADGGAE